MAEPLLRLHALDKRYGALHVTRNVSLDVFPGEVHALIGPNGAGKTTLVSQIAGSTQPDSGHIRFCGQDVTRMGEAARARLGLARVFQISHVITPLSLIENVALARIVTEGKVFGLFRPALTHPGLRTRALEALARVGLADKGEALAGNLSHGERRALELAMALVQEPKLLLLDEPMAGTGKAEGEKLTALLLTLKRDLPMVLVEHDMATVFALADRMSVLIYGEVAVSGAPDEVRESPVVRKAYLGEEEAV